MKWIEKFIEEYAVCPKAATLLREGNFATPQMAWDGWLDGPQMLWVARKFNALTPEQSAEILFIIIREIAGGAVWGVLSKDSREAVVTTEKWLKGNASPNELEVAASLVRSSEELWAALVAGAAVVVSSETVAELWAARAVSRAVESVVSGSPAAADWSESAAIMASVVSGVRTEAAARQEIAVIVREAMPNCPFPRL